MSDINKEKREFIRTKVRRLTSIVKHEGAYKLIEEDEISTPTTVPMSKIYPLEVYALSQNMSY